MEVLLEADVLRIILDELGPSLGQLPLRGRGEAETPPKIGDLGLKAGRRTRTVPVKAGKDGVEKLRRHGIFKMPGTRGTFRISPPKPP